MYVQVFTVLKLQIGFFLEMLMHLSNYLLPIWIVNSREVKLNPLILFFQMSPTNFILQKIIDLQISLRFHDLDSLGHKYLVKKAKHFSGLSFYSPFFLPFI